MTLKHISFSDSPVMRELLRNSIKSNTLPMPTLSEIIADAGETKQDILVPTGEMLLDIAYLTDGLRRKGFSRDADSLESRYLAYKQAEAVRFDDILEQAHPDGDTRMADSKEGLGDVETKPSAHEKIVSVVTKVPTGKQADVNFILKSVASALKLGETTAPSMPDEANTQKFHEMTDGLKTSLFQLAGMIVKDGFTSYPALNQYLANPPVLGVTNDNKRAILVDFKNRFSVLHTLLEGSDEREHVGIIPLQRDAFYKKLNEVLGQVNGIQSFLSGLIGEKSQGELHNKVDLQMVSHEQAQAASAPFVSAIKYLDQWKKVASPVDQKTAQQYIGIATGYASTINYISGNSNEFRYGKLFAALVAQNPKNAALTTIESLITSANNFLASVRDMITKKLASDQNEEMIRTAQLDIFQLNNPSAGKTTSPVVVPITGPTKPAVETSDDPLQQKLNEKTQGTAPVTPQAPHASELGSSPRLAPEEKDHVQAMQFSLLRLASFLQGKEEQYKSARGAIPILINVGKGKNRADMDGAWGTNTQKALVKAKEVIDEWNSLNPKNTIPGDITPGPLMRQKGAADAADRNTSVLTTFFAKVGMDTAGLGSAGTNVMYDIVGAEYALSHADTPVYSKDLESLAAFYQFLKKSAWVEEQQVPNESGGEVTVGMKIRDINNAIFVIASSAKAKVLQKATGAAYYYQAIVNLMHEFQGKTANTNQDSIMPAGGMNGSPGKGLNGLNSDFFDKAKRFIDQGHDFNKNHGPSGVGYSGGPGDGTEGYDQEQAPGPDPLVPPFGPEIDFSNQYFRRVTSAFPEARSIGLLPFTDFYRWGAREFVNNFTSTRGAQNPEQATQQALEALGYTAGPTGWTIFDPRTNRQTRWTGDNDPRVQQMAQRALNVNPYQKSVEFLNYLGKAVNDAKADWISRANPARRAKVDIYRWQQKWQEAIANKLDEIRDLRSR